MREPRDITKVIDAMAAIAPELRDRLRSIRNTAGFTAPELMVMRWNEAHCVLAAWSKSGVPIETVDRVGRIWSGQDPLPETANA